MLDDLRWVSHVVSARRFPYFHALELTWGPLGLDLRPTWVDLGNTWANLAPEVTFGAPGLTFGAPGLTFGAPGLTFGAPGVTLEPLNSKKRKSSSPLHSVLAKLVIRATEG